MTEPYYQDDYVTIYHGDAREVLPRLDLDPVDLVLTDPPYGLGELWVGGGGTSATSWTFDPNEAKTWDDDTVDDVIAEILRLDAQVVIWGGNYYDLPPSRCWLIWDKKQPDTFTTGQAEMAWTNLDRPVRIFRMSQVEAYGKMHKQHPTQKPIELMTWTTTMIDRSNFANVILDPFAGSGTTLRAAKDLGRQAIGIELDERYCEVAATRMGQEVLPL